MRLLCATPMLIWQTIMGRSSMTYIRTKWELLEEWEQPVAVKAIMQGMGVLMELETKRLSSCQAQ